MGSSSARPVSIRPSQAHRLARDLSAAWEEFHSRGTLLPVVRPLIASSWRRAQELGVSPRLQTSVVDSGFKQLLESQTRQLLVRAAARTVDRLEELTEGTPLTLTLADGDGVILLQRGDRAMRRRGESLGMVPGSRWSEADAGTNGMGTALFVRQTTQVFAAEHYCEGFHSVMCTASPVRHPLTRQVLGVFDITTGFRDGSGAMWALVTQIVGSVEREMRNELTASDQMLLEALTRSGESIAYAVDLEGRHTISNRNATSSLGPTDYAVLGGIVERVLTSGDRDPVVQELQGGRRVVVDVSPVLVGDEPLGAVVALRDEPRRAALRRPLDSDAASEWAPFMAAAEWLGAAEVASRSADPVLVVGEAGAGKSTMAATLHRRRGRTGRLVQIDCPSVDAVAWEMVWESCAGGSGDTILLRHVDELDPQLQRRLIDRLDQSGLLDPAVVATASVPSEEALRMDGGIRRDLIDRIAVRLIRVPPLRERAPEFQFIVQQLLLDIGMTRRSLAPEAQAILQAYDWPGNVRQLRNVLRRAADHVPNGRIDVRSLPPELVAQTAGSHLTRIEQVQFAAILDALQMTSGNVSRAAEHLGLSRATVYRWLHVYEMRRRVQDP